MKVGENVNEMEKRGGWWERGRKRGLRVHTRGEREGKKRKGRVENKREQHTTTKNKRTWAGPGTRMGQHRQKERAQPIDTPHLLFYSSCRAVAAGSMVVEKRVQHPRLERLVYFIQEGLILLGLLAGLDTLGCLQVKVYVFGLVEN